MPPNNKKSVDLIPGVAAFAIVAIGGSLTIGSALSLNGIHWTITILSKLVSVGIFAAACALMQHLISELNKKNGQEKDRGFVVVLIGFIGGAFVVWLIMESISPY